MSLFYVRYTKKKCNMFLGPSIPHVDLKIQNPLSLHKVEIHAWNLTLEFHWNATKSKFHASVEQNAYSRVGAECVFPTWSRVRIPDVEFHVCKTMKRDAWKQCSGSVATCVQLVSCACLDKFIRSWKNCLPHVRTYHLWARALVYHCVADSAAKYFSEMDHPSRSLMMLSKTKVSLPAERLWRMKCHLEAHNSIEPLPKSGRPTKLITKLIIHIHVYTYTWCAILFLSCRLMFTSLLGPAAGRRIILCPLSLPRNVGNRSRDGAQQHGR